MSLPFHSCRQNWSSLFLSRAAKTSRPNDQFSNSFIWSINYPISFLYYSTNRGGPFFSRGAFIRCRSWRVRCVMKKNKVKFITRCSMCVSDTPLLDTVGARPRPNCTVSSEAWERGKHKAIFCQVLWRNIHKQLRIHSYYDLYLRYKKYDRTHYKLL